MMPGAHVSQPLNKYVAIRNGCILDRESDQSKGKKL
jgi:hypothetical protein